VFPHGQEILNNALLAGQAISYLFVRKDKGWINAPVAGKQATLQEEYSIHSGRAFTRYGWFAGFQRKPPLAEVSNTVRLAYVSVSLYWSRFDGSIYKNHILLGTVNQKRYRWMLQVTVSLLRPFCLCQNKP
jgi:hypothetical protein